MPRIGIVTGSVLLLLIGGVFAYTKLDLERHSCDLERLEKLEKIEPPTSSADFLIGDWPQWRGPNRDGLSLETDLCRTWPPEGPRVVWRKSIGRGFSAVAVVGRRLFTMDEDRDDAPDDGGRCPPTAVSAPQEGVLCLDAQTGDELWHFRSPNSYAERFGSGPRSTPAVDENRVYAIGPTGFLYCLSVDTGELLWRRDLMADHHGRPMRYGVAFSPLVEGDLVITTPGGPDGNAVVAFNKHTGAVVWKTLDDPMGYSSPMAVTLAGVRQLLIFTNTALVSLPPADGRTYWRHPWETEGGFNIATPLTFGDYVFISSGYGKGCALLEIARDADGSWQANRVYEHNRMRNHFASSVRLGDHLYGFDQTDLVCMELRTGKIVWRESIRSFGKGSLLIADGHLIVLGESGKLFLAEASPDGYHEKASFQVSQNKCWTVPTVARGKLYVRTESEIICFDLRQRRPSGDLAAVPLSLLCRPEHYRKAPAGSNR
jgi:outer membrane protein assembly factor BamB